MKAVILAAGNGKRMQPLTFTTPKPLLKWKGKTLIEHAIGILPEEVDEVIIVVGYLKEQFFEFFKEGTTKKVTLVVQDAIAGTAPALMLCRDHLGNGRFIVMYADDIHDAEAAKRLLDYDLALLTSTVADARPYGVIEKGPEGAVIDIVEKPEHPKTNEVAVGVYLLDGRIFSYFDNNRKDSKEYYLTELISRLVHDHKVTAVPASFWKKITEPSDLAEGRDE